MFRLNFDRNNSENERIGQKLKKKQVAVFLNIIGIEELELYNKCMLTQAKQLLQPKCEAYCALQNIIERFVFNSIIQLEQHIFGSFAYNDQDDKRHNCHGNLQ